MKNNNKLEKIFSKSLELYEKGKSISEILDLYPDYSEELQEIFQTIQMLTHEKENLIPPKELLAKIISQIKIPEEVTKIEESRYLHRGEIKGRPSIFQSLTKTEWLIMSKKIYIGIGVLALALLVIGGIYWQSERQKVAVSPIEIESEVSFEEQSLNQDIAELEGVEEGKSLENLEQDLGEIAEESVPVTPGEKIDITSIENLESELDSELSSLSNDLSDLEGGVVNDTSLDNLDSGLSGIVE